MIRKWESFNKFHDGLRVERDRNRRLFQVEDVFLNKLGNQHSLVTIPHFIGLQIL